MNIARTTTPIEPAAERILRSLPMWFDQEESTLEYIRDTSRYPTFVATDGDAICGLITLQQHFPQACQIHSIAVHAARRSTS